MVHLFMANALNAQDTRPTSRTPLSQRCRPACLPKHKLKLPPLLPTTHLISNEVYTEQEQQHTNSSVSLPRLGLASLAGQHNKQSENKQSSKQLNCPRLPRVYDVLPPIGQTKLKPTPPLELREPNHAPPRNVSKRRVPHRTKKPALTNLSTDSDQVVGERKPVEKTNCTAQTQGSSNSEQGTVNRVYNDTFAGREVDDDASLVRDDPHTLHSVTEYSLTCVKLLIEDEPGSFPDNGFLQFSTIPKALQPYGDVYPPSPPSYDRRARNTVERTRHELKEENRIRVSYIKKYGGCRRNATCVELGDVLRNVAELLREVFLRKTMEELCMLW